MKLKYFQIDIDERQMFLEPYTRVERGFIGDLEIHSLRNEGYLPSNEDIAFTLGLTDDEWLKYEKRLLRKSITDDKGRFLPLFKQAYDNAVESYNKSQNRTQAATAARLEKSRNENVTLTPRSPKEKEKDNIKDKDKDIYINNKGYNSIPMFEKYAFDKPIGKIVENEDGSVVAYKLENNSTVKGNLTVQNQSVTEYKKPKEVILEEQYELLKQAYPKRDVSHNKKMCTAALKRALQGKESFEAILAGAVAFEAHCRASSKERRFIKMMPTWLNQEDWKLTYEKVSVMREEKKVHVGVGGVMEKLRQEKEDIEFNETMGNLKDVTDCLISRNARL
jgi:hypothetical protein